MKKKLLFFVFASLLYLQSISPVLAASDAVTADGFQYTTSGLTATITKYTGTASTVNIPSKINDYTVTKVEYNAFVNNLSITNVIFPSSVTEIGNNAFSGCTALVKITLPSGLKTLGAGFISGTAVTSLTIPASLTSCSTNSSGGPLDGAEKLTDLTIESGMEKIPDYLAYCVANTSHITTVSIPNTVTSIGRSSFYNCPLLGEINIPGSVTSIADNAFDGWKNLVFKGISGTTAETYANEKGIPFKESIQEGTWVLAGRLDGVDTSNRTIDLEERVYNVSSDFDINTASNIIKNSSDRIVVFTCSDGKITHMEAAEDIVQVSISLVEYGLGSDNFTYENNQYSGALSYHVKLKTTIDPKSSYSLSEFRQLLPNYTISVARIQVKPVTPLTAHFTDIDLNYATGEFNTPVKLGLNNYKNVATVVFNVDSSFVPEKAKTELSATFYAQHHKNFTVDSNQVKFTITNKDYYRQQAEKKKEQSKNTKGKDFPSLPSQSAPRTGLSATPSAGSDAARNACSPEKPRRRTYKEQKEFEALENEILELEEKKSVLEAQMADSDFTKARKAGEEYTKAEERLNQAYERWSELAELSEN